jgi:maltose-binding protein MalE
LGLGENIEQAPNIISSLMLQNGTEIVSPDRLSAYFQNPQTTSTGESAYTGRAAIDFYTGFATSGKSVYTWNRDFATSARQAFLDNKLAMLVDDSQFYSTIKSSQAKYSFDIIPLPQLSTEAPSTYASYWLETVTSNSKNSALAWDFLAYATTNSNNVQSYLSNTKKASALVSKTEDFHSDALGLNVFKAQARIARSWYKGPQPNTVDKILAQWADDIVINGKTNVEATSVAASRLTTLLQSVIPPPAPDVVQSAATTTSTPNSSK